MAYSKRRGIPKSPLPLTFQILILLLIVSIPYLSKSCTETENQSPDEKISAPIVEEKVARVFRTDTINPGVFTFDKVVDGDTIRIVECKEPLRLLCVDCEETFKYNQKNEKELAEKDWKAYVELKNKRRGVRPVKYSTPFGDYTTKFTKDYFEAVTDVEIEFDTLDRIIDFFDRPLVYVLVEKNGVMFNYNVELVRNGLTPYYAKYGYSLRYHDEFIKAEKEARENKRGIWGVSANHYPDYNERVAWWNERAESIKRFEEKHGADDNYFIIQNDSDWARLIDYIGEEITVFGTIDQTRHKKLPYRAYMQHKQGRSVIIETESDELITLVRDKYFDERYVYFTGKLETIENDFIIKFTNKSQIRY